MRLFIALDLDDQSKDKITDLQDQLKKAGMKARWTASENLHITLAFIGEYDNPKTVEEILKEMPFEAFELDFNVLGHFGNLYWLGFEENPSLNQYAAALKTKLKEKDIPIDGKKFKGHITLARKAAEVPVLLPEVKAWKTCADQVTLFESRLSKSGPRYIPLFVKDASGK